MKFIAGLCAAMAISTVGVLGAAFAEASAPKQTKPQDITAVGCIRAWQPTTDATKLPDNSQPGVHGVFLLTPLNTGQNPLGSLPTYVLTPTQVANFSQHLDDKVEVIGFAEAAPAPPTRQTIGAITGRPENKPTAETMPRLTIRSLKKVSDSCP